MKSTVPGSGRQGRLRWHHRAVATAGLAMLVLSSGCVSRMAADRLMAAPNLEAQKNHEARSAAWAKFLGLITTNALVSVTIPVGPPEATLSAIEVPAHEYHRRFVTQFESKAEGRRSFSLLVQTNVQDTFTPLPVPATILLLHGYGMRKESMVPWAFQLAQAGFRVVAIDLRGHGQSTGDTIGFGKYETADLSQALDRLMADGLCDEQVGVLGVSYGATLALNWAARERRIRTVVAIAPYDRPQEAFERFADLSKAPFARRVIRRAASRVSAKLDLKWSDWSGAAGLRGMTQPVLIVGGGQDPISRPDDIVRLKNSAGGEVESLILPEADHYVVSVSLDALAEPVNSWMRTKLAGTAAGGAGGRE